MKHVLIIGGGVIGLCTAYYSALRGHRVTVVERHLEDRDGCSFGNAGMIVPSHFIPLAAPGMVALGLKWMGNPESPFYIKPRWDWELWKWGIHFWRACTDRHVQRSAPLLRDLNLASRACFEELAALPGEGIGLAKRGLVVLCKTEKALDEEGRAVAKARELGIPAELLDKSQTAKLDPKVSMDVVGSVYFPKDCHLSPNRLMAALTSWLEEAGVAIVWGGNVASWKTSPGRIDAVSTQDGDLVADEYVLCAGSWSQEVAKGLGLRIPMQAGKGYSVTLQNPRQLPEICAILHEARVAVTPMASSLRFGGTMEIAGMSERINPVRVQGIIKSVSRYYPDFTAADFEGVKPWCGLRPCSPDGLPYLGRTSRYGNLTIATGHAMMGLSLGPITGRLVSEIISDEPPSIPVHLLNPDRYQ